ncbi:triacylglycerol lipase, partial [Pseudomonas aeruginosa]
MRPPRPRRRPCPRLPIPGHGRRDTGSLCRRRAGPGPGRHRQAA